MAHALVDLGRMARPYRGINLKVEGRLTISGRLAGEPERGYRCSGVGKTLRVEQGK
jgi:hypothetical protein